MDNLIKRLQDEAGLTEEQSLKVVTIVKDFMDKEGLDIDWNKFFKGKYEDFVGKAKNIFSGTSKDGDSYTEKIADKVDELATKAKKGAHDISKKAADFFDEK